MTIIPIFFLNRPDGKRRPAVPACRSRIGIGGLRCLTSRVSHSVPEAAEVLFEIDDFVSAFGTAVDQSGAAIETVGAFDILNRFRAGGTNLNGHGHHVERQFVGIVHQDLSFSGSEPSLVEKKEKGQVLYAISNQIWKIGGCSQFRPFSQKRLIVLLIAILLVCHACRISG